MAPIDKSAIALGLLISSCSFNVTETVYTFVLKRVCKRWNDAIAEAWIDRLGQTLYLKDLIKLSGVTTREIRVNGHTVRDLMLCIEQDTNNCHWPKYLSIGTISDSRMLLIRNRIFARTKIATSLIADVALSQGTLQQLSRVLHHRCKARIFPSVDIARLRVGPSTLDTMNWLLDEIMAFAELSLELGPVSSEGDQLVGFLSSCAELFVGSVSLTQTPMHLYQLDTLKWVHSLALTDVEIVPSDWITLASLPELCSLTLINPLRPDGKGNHHDAHYEFRMLQFFYITLHQPASKQANIEWITDGLSHTLAPKLHALALTLPSSHISSLQLLRPHFEHNCSELKVLFFTIPSCPLDILRQWTWNRVEELYLDSDTLPNITDSMLETLIPTLQNLQELVILPQPIRLTEHSLLALAEYCPRLRLLYLTMVRPPTLCYTPPSTLSGQLGRFIRSIVPGKGFEYTPKYTFPNLKDYEFYLYDEVLKLTNYDTEVPQLWLDVVGRVVGGEVSKAQLMAGPERDYYLVCPTQIEG